jgi:uncharacterized protein (DUF2267 family)
VVYIALVEETFTCICAAIKEEGEVFVQYEEFLNKVQDRIGPADPDETRRAVTATLSTLSERISGGEAKDLAAQLPEELKEPIQRSGEEAEGFSFEEFLRRVGEREGANTDAARDHASAVITALGEAVTGEQLDDVRAQLPQEFAPLFQYGG